MPASCRSSLRCRTPCAARTTLPRSCACLCTTHMPIKRPLPHLQVARQTSLLYECIGSTLAACAVDWAPSSINLLSSNKCDNNHWVCHKTWCSYIQHASHADKSLSAEQCHMCSAAMHPRSSSYAASIIVTAFRYISLSSVNKADY